MFFKILQSNISKYKKNYKYYIKIDKNINTP